MSNLITNNLDELIEQERRRAAERIAKLKRAAAVEQRRVDEKVVELLRGQKHDLYERLAHEAVDSLSVEKAKRSSRAKRAVSSSREVLDEPASRAAEPGNEEEASWNE